VNEKDAQHTRLWQRFLSEKEAACKKDPSKATTTYQPITSTMPMIKQSPSSLEMADDSTITADDSNKPQQTATVTSPANSNTEIKTEAKSTPQISTLDQQKQQQESKAETEPKSTSHILTLNQQEQQQESKIDTKTILSTIKQVAVPQVAPSSLRPRNNIFETFSKFKEEVLSNKSGNITANVSKSAPIIAGMINNKS
jgi:hypothetical protein